MRRLDRVRWLADSWFEDFDLTPVDDPRNPSEADQAYDDAGCQILAALAGTTEVEPATTVTPYKHLWRIECGDMMVALYREGRHVVVETPLDADGIPDLIECLLMARDIKQDSV